MSTDGFGGTGRLHIQGWNVKQARNQHEECSKPGFSCDILPRIVDYYSMEYMEIYPTKHNPS
jgi:hypothetical protein